MRTIFLSIVTFIFVSSFCNAQDADMKAWIEYMTPGEMHTLMAKDVGEWETKLSFWSPGNPEPNVSLGKCKSEMILGGRYLQTTFLSETNGMKMEGISLQAYDNITKEFITTWIDNMGTGLMVTYGKYDSATRTYHFSGKAVDPAQKKEIPFREEVKYTDDDHMTMDMYYTYDKEEVLSMKIEFSRIKK